MTHISPISSPELEALRDLAELTGELVNITHLSGFTTRWWVTVSGIQQTGRGSNLDRAVTDLFEQLAVDVSLTLPDGRTVHWDWDASVWNVKAPAVAA